MDPLGNFRVAEIAGNAVAIWGGIIVRSWPSTVLRGRIEPLGRMPVQPIPATYQEAYDLGSLRAMAVNALPMVKRLDNPGMSL